MTLEKHCETMLQTFKKYSGKDGNSGELDQAELCQLVKNEFPSLSGSGKDEEAVGEVMKMMDMDGDKRVTYKEFAMFLAILSMVMEEGGLS
ncbi:protein S100-A4-like [Pleurodeles waltl]|uniref:protein S100-A4-like n=1 Tax=Pleurodeles waltl TaxID=8319 RepID=UPI0037094979